MQTQTLSTLTVTDWHADFALWLHETPTAKHRARDHKSISAYLSDIAHLTRWFTAQNRTAFEPSHLNSGDLRNYFRRVELEFQPASYDRKLASARMLIKWALSAGLIDHDPAADIPKQNYIRETPRDLNDDERGMMELAAEDGEATVMGRRDALIFFLMSNAGMRISEVVNLREDDLDLEHRRIHVYGKGKKHRNPILGEKLIAKINAWLAVKPASTEGTLITDEHGHAIGREQAWRRFNLIAERAAVNCTPHALRHTYIRRYMDAYMAGDPSRWGSALKAVCQQTGDTDEVILKCYTGARESDMRSAAEQM